MTAPISPHPPPLVWVVCFGTIAVAVALPFGGRDDWLGWLSLSFLSMFAVFLWAILTIGCARAALAWYRDRPTAAEDPRVGECYAGHVYKISWDHDWLCLRACSGQAVVQVPLDNIWDAIDIDALILEGDVKIVASGRQVLFPKSRSARFKIEQLICDLGKTSTNVKRGMEQQRSVLTRRFAKWFPVSLVTAGFLLLPILVLPDPQQLNLLWTVAGIGYGFAWWLVFWRFAYSLACLLGARRLQSFLNHTSSRTNNGMKASAGSGGCQS